MQIKPTNKCVSSNKKKLEKNLPKHNQLINETYKVINHIYKPRKAKAIFKNLFKSSCMFITSRVDGKYFTDRLLSGNGFASLYSQTTL